MEDYAFLFKTVLIGNAGVGKTCLVRQFTQGKYPTRQGATIGVDFLIKQMEVKGQCSILSLTLYLTLFRNISKLFFTLQTNETLNFMFVNSKKDARCPGKYFPTSIH